MSRAFLFLFCFVIFTSCSQDELESVQNEASEIEDMFPLFPDSPFLDLEFSEPINQTKSKLIQQGFIEDTNQERDWSIDNEAIKILYPEQENLQQFKLFFFDKKEAFLSDLLLFFKEKSQKRAKNNVFSTFEIESRRNKFSVSVFKYDNLIRLEFKMGIAH